MTLLETIRRLKEINTRGYVVTGDTETIIHAMPQLLEFCEDMIYFIEHHTDELFDEEDKIQTGNHSVKVTAQLAFLKKKHGLDKEPGGE